MENDIANLVKDFPIELQNKILLRAMTVMSKNIGGAKNPGQRSSYGRPTNNIFLNRGFD